jgi:hypothetical protein
MARTATGMVRREIGMTMRVRKKDAGTPVTHTQAVTAIRIAPAQHTATPDTITRTAQADTRTTTGC